MDFARQLKASLNIVEIVGEKVRLKRAGSTDSFKGLCPFHQEKTPSFNVNIKYQIFKCFGCGESGDAIEFVMKMESLTFWEAVKVLADRNGIPLPKREHTDPDAKQRDALYRMNEIAQTHFRSLLDSSQGADARAYLAKRGAGKEAITQFGLGLSDRQGNTITQRLMKEGFSPEQLEKSGLVLKRQEGGGYFDRFRGRLMFPIHDENARLCGFAGRALQADDQVKYMNSPETLLYRKTYLLYNLHRAKENARKQGRILLVEGYMDVIGLWLGGISNAVASCGTALTAQQVRLMKRNVDQVTVNFDPDPAGSTAAERSIQTLLDEDVRVRILELDEELDPDEYVQKHGAERYLQVAGNAPAYYMWMADRARKRFDLQTGEGKAKALDFLLPTIHQIADKVERAAVADELASALNIERGLLLERFRKAALDRSERHVKAVAPSFQPVELILLNTLLAYPELRDQLLSRLGLDEMEQFRSKAIFSSLQALAKHEPDFAYSDLEARLEENDRALLSRMVFADEMNQIGDQENARLTALSCLETIAKGKRQRKVRELRQLIAEAQAKGDINRARQLWAEMDRLGRSPLDAHQG